MDTVIRKIDVNNIDREVMEEASQVLNRGGMVAFPTETVYGLGADALDEKASAKIYAAKGRPSDNPLIVHISDIEQLDKLVCEIPDNAKKLMDAFWPGPMTLIFKKSGLVPDGTTGGLDTVAVRMPNHKVALELIRTSGVAIAAPSANTSGRPSPTTAAHVADDLSGKIDMIIDGGAVGIGIESTIVDVTSEIPMVLRPGYITMEMLEKVVGKVGIDKAITGPVSPDVKPKAPGMKYKHYAPKAELTMFKGELKNVVEHINNLTDKNVKSGIKTGIIACEETKDMYKAGEVLSIGSRNNEDTIAHNLYGVLRKFDDMNVDVIYGETFEDNRLGQAIMNRLLKAAGYHVEKV
ncbi:MAG: threonylcarbamoyl-AMP synthase [Lachnospiraceae bacterium]|nr:threonylcarbamoyl-AMP synthase [Lachnospiraceae bacterium]